MHPDEYVRYPRLIEEFKNLARNSFTFVPNWQDPIITPDVFRILSRKKSSQEACDDYISQVKFQLDARDYIEVQAIDLQNPVNSLMDWSLANESVSKALDKKTKEPRSIILFKGAVYEFTYNEKGLFSQSQIGVMINLPNRNNMNQNTFEKIVLYVAPTGMKNYVYSSDHNGRRQSLHCRQNIVDRQALPGQCALLFRWCLNQMHRILLLVERLPKGLLADMINGCVDHNSSNPTFKRTFRSEPVDAREHLQEPLLHDILHGIPVRHIPHTDPEHQPIISVEDPALRQTVTLLTTANVLLNDVLVHGSRRR